MLSREHSAKILSIFKHAEKSLFSWSRICNSITRCKNQSIGLKTSCLMYLSRKLLMFFFSSFVFLLNNTSNQVVNCAIANLATTSGVIVRSCNNESDKVISELQFPTSNLFNNTAKEIMTGDTHLNSCSVFLSNQNLSFSSRNHPIKWSILQMEARALTS